MVTMLHTLFYDQNFDDAMKMLRRNLDRKNI